MMRLTWSTLSRGVALSSLTLALAACQSLRGPEPKAAPQIPAAFNSVQGTTAIAGNSIASEGWKDFFTDARLQQVIQQGLNNNRDLRVAALNIQKAKAQYQISGNALIPEIDGNAGVTRARTLSSAGRTNTAYSVGLGTTAYELDFFGRVRDLKDAALQSYLSTQDAHDTTQISLIAQIAETWLAVSYDNGHLQLAQQTLKLQEEAYKLNKRRFDVGIDNEVSVRQAQMSVETARGDVANYQTKVQQDLNLLNLLVGQPVTNDLLPTSLVQQITTSSALAAGLPSDLLKNRPDIGSAEHQLLAAGANLGAARARLFPSISLTGSAGYASTDLSNLFKSGAFVWSIAPTLNLPIFDMGTRLAGVKVAKADQDIALSNYEKSIQTAFREVSDVLATRATINDRVGAQSSFVDAANVNYKLSNARFKAGIDSYLNVLTAQQSQYAAQQNLLTLQQVNLNSQIDLYKTLGGGVTATANAAKQ